MSRYYNNKAIRYNECIHRDEETLESLLEIKQDTAICKRCKQIFHLEEI